jgi:hypothetical protein
MVILLILILMPTVVKKLEFLEILLNKKRKQKDNK